MRQSLVYVTPLPPPGVVLPPHSNGRLGATAQSRRIMTLTVVLTALLLTPTAAVDSCTNLENGIPPSAGFLGQGIYSLCDSSYFVPGHSSLGTFSCWNEDSCVTIARYLGYGTSVGDCDKFAELFKDNGVCDSFLNCEGTFSTANETADCALSSIKTEDNTTALYSGPQSPEAEWLPGCDTSAGTTAVSVRIYDFGEDGISDAVGSIGGMNLMELQQAIIITLDPVELPTGCTHTFYYRSDLFSHIHNYVVVYAANGEALASGGFELGGTYLNVTLGKWQMTGDM